MDWSMMWDTSWKAMTALDVPVLEKVLRPMVVYLALVLLLRIFGKRELSQMKSFDLVVLLCLSNTVQNSIIGKDNTVVGGLIGAVSLLSINYGTIWFLMRHRKVDRALEGKATVLMRDGEPQAIGMKKEMMALNDLTMVAHDKGYDGLQDLKEVILQPSGIFTVKPKVDPQKELLARLDRIEKLLAARNPGHGLAG